MKQRYAFFTYDAEPCATRVEWKGFRWMYPSTAEAVNREEQDGFWAICWEEDDA